MIQLLFLSVILKIKTLRDLLKHRSGLGFNSRAMRLQACAQEIIKTVGANTIRLSLPKDRAELQKLPGI